MVGPSKILTVSYGTFSCTLEGFDDPFATMRGIAEYFRDLAADDRYFGAEPPTPDAEMLHRIAEREVHRRVEARVENNSVVLRQMQDPAEPSVGRAATDMSAAAAAGAVSETESEQESEDTEPALRAASGVSEAPARDESVAAKLARLRAAVAHRENDSNPDDEEEAAIVDSPATSTIAAAFEAEASENEPEVSAAPETMETEIELADEDQTRENISEPEIQVGDNEPDVFGSSPAIALDEVVVEDESADLVDFGDSEEPEISVEAEEAPETPIVESALESEESAVDDQYEAPAAEDYQMSDEISDDHSEIAVDWVEETEEEDVPVLEKHDGPDTDETGDDNDGLSTLILESSVSDNEDEDEEVLQAEEPEGNEPDAPTIARIVKMRRADLEEEIETEAVIEDEEELETDAAGIFAEDDTLEAHEDEEVEAEIDFSYLGSPESAEDEVAENVFGEAEEPEKDDMPEQDEADLMATLAQVRRESEAESRAEKEGRAVLERQDLDDDGNGVKRILDVTNTELEETEGSRRRSAIQHLKAAVLATRADKGLKKSEIAEEHVNPIDKYREDLAQVVRPRRPADGVQPTERRQPPLVLVSEQRIDLKPEVDGIEAGTSPVRPRRVAAIHPEEEETSEEREALDATGDEANEDGADEVFADANAVAEFVEEMGAADLPDLVEALAAYAAYVAGQPEFTRPQMMRAIATYCGDDFSREDGLRAFGQLLRNGGIQKLNQRLFAVSQSTRFNPGARAAGE